MNTETPDQRTLCQIREVVQVIPDVERAKVLQIYHAIMALRTGDLGEWELAIALVGAEQAAKPENQPTS